MMSTKKVVERQFPLPFKSMLVSGSGSVVAGRFQPASTTHLGAVDRRLADSGVFGTKQSKSRA